MIMNNTFSGYMALISPLDNSGINDEIIERIRMKEDGFIERLISAQGGASALTKLQILLHRSEVNDTFNLEYGPDRQDLSLLKSAIMDLT